MLAGMLRWKNEALFALAGLVSACSGSSTGQGSQAQVGGSTMSSSSSAGAGGGSTSLGTNVGGTTTALSTVGDTGGTLGTTGGGVTAGGASVGGGAQSFGGSKATGGTRASGGSKPIGGTASIGGTSATGATSAGNKRGIAANVAPGVAFNPSVSWWYNWANKASGANVGIEFVPMVWNQTTVSSALPSGSKYVLGFNEPNFFSQANLSASQAASYWPALQSNANSTGARIVGPA